MNVVSYMRISKHLILSLCLILCSCFTHPKQSQSPLCSDSDVPVPYPCRLDKDIAKKILIHLDEKIIVIIQTIAVLKKIPLFMLCVVFQRMPLVIV